MQQRYRNRVNASRGGTAQTSTRHAVSSGGWPVSDRAIVSTVLGIPPFAAVGLAFGLTLLGVFVDLLRIDTVGLVFHVVYVLGSVLAVMWVRWRDLLGPMVQPPLLVTVAVPAGVLLASVPHLGSGFAEWLLVIGALLVNAFPTMALATALAVIIGMGRIVLQGPGREVGGGRWAAGGTPPSAVHHGDAQR